MRLSRDEIFLLNKALELFFRYMEIIDRLAPLEKTSEAESFIGRIRALHKRVGEEDSFLNPEFLDTKKGDN